MTRLIMSSNFNERIPIEFIEKLKNSTTMKVRNFVCENGFEWYFNIDIIDGIVYADICCDELMVCEGVSI